ncbi:Fc.00g116100.m01.CDS01 [Cosmosporella sp. VM-42]
MLRSHLNRLRNEAPGIQTRVYKRAQTYAARPANIPPLRIIGPTLWCLAAAGTFFIGCAGWEVYQDAQKVKKKHFTPTTASYPITYDQLEHVRASAWLWNRQTKPIMLQDIPSTRWEDLPGTDKMVASAIGLNAAIFAISRVLPSLQLHFSHIPAGGFNYTLLSSMFGHAGTLHLGLNMYGLYNFTPGLARSRTFQGSGAHLTAFYLSAGVFASLAHHLTSKWASPRALRSSFLSHSLGASGAIFAILGAWGMMFPNAQIGILFLPGSLPADQALAAIALFEAYGVAVGFKSLKLGHAAHLGGLAIGSGYVYFDGNRRIWQPLRRTMFNQMKRLAVI